MSGGAYDYAFGKINDLADQIQEKGNCFTAPPHMRKAFKEHLRKVAAACKAIEWNDSGDGDVREEKILREILGPSISLGAAVRSAEQAQEALEKEIARAKK